ncbi:MAG: FtsW/RodA/SpoVE family cell cycle protein, partial [Enterococcus hulanensis]
MMKRKKIDWLLLLPYLGASLIGLLIVFSASSYRLMAEGENPLSLFSKQAIFMGLSWLLIAVIYRVKSDVLVNGTLAKGLLAVGLVSLLLVKISGVSINGAQRWVSLFGIQFQPSEVTNVALILYLAYFFRVKRTRRELRIPCGLVLLSGLMILLQPKVTGAIIIWGIALVIITTAELPYQLSMFIFLTLIVGIALIGGVILFLGSHQLLPE